MAGREAGGVQIGQARLSRSPVATSPEELGCGIVPETPGRKRDRGHQGFKMARRQINDQPSDLALRTAVSLAAMTSRCQLIARLVCGLRSWKQRPAKVAK